MTWEVVGCVLLLACLALLIAPHFTLWLYCRSMPTVEVDDGRPDPDDAGFWKAAFDRCDYERRQWRSCTDFWRGEVDAAAERATTAEGLVAAVQETLAEVQARYGDDASNGSVLDWLHCLCECPQSGISKAILCAYLARENGNYGWYWRAMGRLTAPSASGAAMHDALYADSAEAVAVPTDSTP